jgi:hypothetical protein
MAAEFPFLEDYEHLWPLDLLLIAQLKYKTAASKGSTSKKTLDSLHNSISALHPGGRRK